LVKYKDYYSTLCVPRNASEKDIKAAYRKLARQHHPDVNPGDKHAEDKFKDIAEAYEVLSDSDKRKRYDTLGANWKAGADFTPPPGFSGFQFDFSDLSGFGRHSPFSDFFETLFGQTFAASQGAPGGRRTSKGTDQEADIELSIEEAALGASRNVHITAPGQKPRTLQVKIPAGVRTGSKVRVAGEAGPNPMGGPPGDLYLKVKLKPHPYFAVEGDNLVSELVVSPALAVLGGEAQVTTLDGSVRINIPPMSQAGRMLRLRERGLPKLKQKIRGDHLVRLKINVPANISEEERELYRKLFDLENQKTEAKASAS
jgi:curved DNA-binding protein